MVAHENRLYPHLTLRENLGLCRPHVQRE